MIDKIAAVVSDENFVEYVWAAIPIVAIILGAIAFTVIALARG